MCYHIISSINTASLISTPVRYYYTNNTDRVDFRILAKRGRTGCNGIRRGQSNMILLEVNTHLTSYQIQCSLNRGTWLKCGFVQWVCVIVQSTIIMRSMLMLGGSGGMPPRKFLKNRCSEIESEGILEAKYHIMHINFKSQNICEIKTSAINICIQPQHINYGINLYKNNLKIMNLKGGVGIDHCDKKNMEIMHLLALYNLFNGQLATIIAA